MKRIKDKKLTQDQIDFLEGVDKLTHIMDPFREWLDNLDREAEKERDALKQKIETNK